MGWWRFVWTTAIGILPATVASVLVGSHMLAASSWEVWAVLALAVLLLAALHRRHWRRRRAGEEKERR